MPGPIGDRDLEDGLCHVDGDAVSFDMMGSSFCLASSDFGTSMPTESQEESISSLRQTSDAPIAARRSQLKAVSSGTEME